MIRGRAQSSIGECVYGPDAPDQWDDVDALELATLGWVHWFNEQRLHGHCGHVSPAEHEAAFHAATDLPHPPKTQTPELPPDPGRFMLPESRGWVAPPIRFLTTRTPGRIAKR